MTQFFDLSPHLSPRGSEHGDHGSPQSKSRGAGKSEAQQGSPELDAPLIEPSPLKFESEARLLAVRNLTPQDLPNFSGVTTPSDEGASEHVPADRHEESLPPRTPRTPLRSNKSRSCTNSQHSSRAQTPTRTPSRDRTPSATPRTDRSYSVPSRYQNFTDVRRAAAGTPKRSRHMSSQELEMQEIEQKREEVRRLRKFNEKSYRRAILGVGTSVGTGIESSRGLTVPKEFNLSVPPVCSFRGFDREKDMMPCNKDWDTSLRTPRRTPATTPRQEMRSPVSPKPWSAHSSPSLKRSASVPPRECQSFGQRSRTPTTPSRPTTPLNSRPTTPSRNRWSPRLTVPVGPSMMDRPSNFRSRSVSRDDLQPEPSVISCTASFMSATSRFEESIDQSRRGRSWTNKLTEPEPFDLSCNYRVRSTSVKSRDEREDEAMQRFKSTPFKARRVPRSCQEKTSSSIPIVEKRSLTVPNEFNLSVSHSERSLSRSRRDLHSESEDSRPCTPFRARKIPKGILDGPTFVPKQAEAPLTCPESPSMLSQERSMFQSKRDLSTDSQRSESFRAREMPDFDKICFKPSPSTQNLTQPAPPQLGTDVRGALHRARLEKRLLDAETEEAIKRDFHARPIVQTAPLQEIRPQQPRTPKKDQNSDMIKTPKKDLDKFLEAAERAREARQAVDHTEQVPVFRARPCPSTTYRRGALPEAPERALTVPTGVELHSSVRSQSRETYDRERNQRLSEEEEQKRLLEQERSVQEQQEIFSIRKSQAFKAKPIPSTTYEPGKLPEKQARRLTVPVEPSFAPHPSCAPRAESSDKENSIEPDQYSEPPAWRSARSALKKVRN